VSRVFPRIWTDYAQQMKRPITWSFNLPDHTGDLEIIRTRLGQTYYGQCFSQRGDQYFHDLRRFDIDQAPDSDQAVVSGGHVSATLIDLAEIGQNMTD
jgi:broad specificity polyphosphatase/5'/3'-nucleotidase SurE